jgi:branched-subunit amino acid aminotransferase/4-amino-4-deoxychorismate lyase
MINLPSPASDVPIEERFISINGKRINNLKDSTISVFDTSFHRGDGVFEVMRIAPTTINDGNPTIRCLDQHMVRLQTSANAVGCPLPSQNTLIKWLQEAAAASGNQPGSLRLIATKGNDVIGHNVEPSVVISWSPIPSWPDTFTLYPVLAPWHPAGLPGWETPIKWTSYGPNVVSTNKAKAAGFTDALLLSPHRVARPVPPQTWSDVNLRDFHVLDGPNFALAFVEDDATASSPSKATLHLPCNRTLGLLPSITQRQLAQIAEEKVGMTVKRDVYTLGQVLEMADEIFVMSTTRGIKSVTKIGEYDIPHKCSDTTKSKSWVEEFSRLLDETD